MTEYYFPSQLIYLSLVLLLNTVIVEVVVCSVGSIVGSSVVNGRSVICVAVARVCVGVIGVVHVGVIAVVHVGIVAVVHVGVVTIVHIGVVSVGVITVVHIGVVAVVHTGLVEVLVLCAKEKDTAYKAAEQQNTNAYAC